MLFSFVDIKFEKLSDARFCFIYGFLTDLTVNVNFMYRYKSCTKNITLGKLNNL